jgi:hypothetical protein
VSDKQNVVQSCIACHGAGWVWCDEMPNRAGHDPYALVVDDTRYTCHACNGERISYESRAMFACDVCGNVPNGEGVLEHGRGCFVASADGGGDSFVDWVVR